MSVCFCLVERQAVLELLTLSQCAGQVDCVYILILGTQVNHSYCLVICNLWNCYIPYFYPAQDLLLRTAESLGYYQDNGLHGCYLWYLLFRHHQYIRLADIATLLGKS